MPATRLTPIFMEARYPRDRAFSLLLTARDAGPLGAPCPPCTGLFVCKRRPRVETPRGRFVCAHHIGTSTSPPLTRERQSLSPITATSAAADRPPGFAAMIRGCSRPAAAARGILLDTINRSGKLYFVPVRCRHHAIRPGRKTPAAVGVLLAPHRLHGRLKPVPARRRHHTASRLDSLRPVQAAFRLHPPARAVLSSLRRDHVSVACHRRQDRRTQPPAAGSFPPCMSAPRATKPPEPAAVNLQRARMGSAGL